MVFSERRISPKPLPRALYRAEQVRELDRIAIQEFQMPGATLMQRAGEAVFRLICERWPEAEELAVICGVGNNAGDGFVVARLAREMGLAVTVYQLGEAARLQGDALSMAQAYRAIGGVERPFQPLTEMRGVIVDAILGTGLERDVSGQWAEAIGHINSLPQPVVAVDIPSGLHSDTGRVMGVAVEANATISFIGLKQGVFTGAGPDHCGEIHFDSLAVPRDVYAPVTPAANRIDWESQRNLIGPRRRTAHKGDAGHVLVIGGAPGFSGAARMAAEAAARAGAGLVTVATHPDHAAVLNIGRPELMVQAVRESAELGPLLEKANVVAIGPGLGCSAWGRSLFTTARQAALPMVVDADALNLLAEQSTYRQDWVLTPHPGEAGRLLSIASLEVQKDRFQAVKAMVARYGGVVVLKGAGSLIGDGSDDPVSVCSAGNPGMASGGMGDLLTGILAALIAQGLPLRDAASSAVALHAVAADKAAEAGERGLLAMDLIPEIRHLLNQE